MPPMIPLNHVDDPPAQGAIVQQLGVEYGDDSLYTVSKLCKYLRAIYYSMPNMTTFVSKI